MFFSEKFNKILIKIEENKVNLLITITFFCVFLFFFILYKSYNISKIKKDITLLPLVSFDKNNNIKIKHIIENNNLEARDIYKKIDGNDNSSIKVIDNTKNEKYDLNKKINEIIEEEESSNPIREKLEENIVISENIQEININKVDKKTTEQFKDKKNYYKTQLIALTNKQQADIFLQTTKNKYPNLLKNVEIFITEVDLKEKGIFYRVNVGFFKTILEAENFCEAYLKNSNKNLLGCIVVK